VTTIYPFWNVIVRSFTPGEILMVKKVTLFPLEPTFDNYRVIFSDPMLLRALLISVFRTVTGSLSSLLVVSLAAFAMSKRTLKGRKTLMVILLIPMYFGAGLIPNYVNIVRLGLMNNLLVYILPGLFSGMNFLLIMSYMNQLDSSYEESAYIDGASSLRIFASIIIPLSKPILATIALFIAVGQWNAWFDALLYINKSNYLPLQFVLQNIIKQNSFEYLAQKAKGGDTSMLLKYDFTAESISMATMVFTIIPVLCVYPFLQKYFVKGITLGGLKG
jgi:putative aldouronate transport system permease protein